MRRLRRLIMAATATCLLVAGLTPAAQASTSNARVEDTASALVAAAPTCLRSSLNDNGWTDYLRVRNTCGRTVRAKVILAFHTDLPCHTYRPGATKRWSWGWPGRFDGLRNC